MDLCYFSIFCILWSQIYEVYPRFIIPDPAGSGSGYMPPTSRQTSMDQLDDATATPTGQFGDLHVTSVYQELGVNWTGKPSRSRFSVAGPGVWLTGLRTQPRGLTGSPLDQQVNNPSLGEDASSGDYTTQDAPLSVSHSFDNMIAPQRTEDGSGRHDDSAPLG